MGLDRLLVVDRNLVLSVDESPRPGRWDYSLMYHRFASLSTDRLSALERLNPATTQRPLDKIPILWYFIANHAQVVIIMEPYSAIAVNDIRKRTREEPDRPSG